MNLPPNQIAEKAAATKERKERFTTLGGIPLKTVYTQEDLAGEQAEGAIGAPGEKAIDMALEKLIGEAEGGGKGTPK